MKTMTRLLRRDPAGRRARRVAGRTAVVLSAVGAAIGLAGPAFAAPAWVITPTVDPSPQKVAVGSFSAAKGTNSNSFTLTMHWNGSAWKIVPSPNPATPSPVNGVRQTLNGVVAISPTDAWAVGNTVDTVSGSFLPDKPIAMHWNGTAWSVATLPNLGGSGLLASVTANSPTSVWAAGPADGTTSVLHWNGTSWTPETTPVGPDGQPVMKGISAVPGSATEVWAAAITLPSGGGYHTFVVHHP